MMMNLPEANPGAVELSQNLDVNPRVLRRLASEAAAAIAALWDSERKSFWRSTEHRLVEQSKVNPAELLKGKPVEQLKGRPSEQPRGTPELFPTVTFRSVEALLRLIEEQPQWVSPDISTLAIDVVVPALLSYNEKDFKSSLGISSEGNVLNPFTLSLYIDCLATICGCSKIKKTEKDTAAERLLSACTHLLTYGQVANESKFGASVHPFVLYHLLRAVEAAIPRLVDGQAKKDLTTFSESLVNLLRRQVTALLAQDSLGIINPGEGVAIAFCAAALARCRGSENLQFVRAATNVAFKFQDSSGCWPLGRIVRENQDTELKRDLQIPTYEIAWALAEAVSGVFDSGEGLAQEHFVSTCLDGLSRSVFYTASSAVQLESEMAPKRGWCSDHAFGKPIIESWTSATVLQAILSFQTFSFAVERQAVLQSFGFVSPGDAGWPKWQRWAIYKAESEPEEDAQILNYLDRVIVQSIAASPGSTPSAGSRNVSLLLFGPPGTAKTTVVKSLADGLKWPLVSLSPGNFIERGLEYIEAQAKMVFDRLLRLSRVVVLFDECDELFRDRKPTAATDQVRNITAFVTASMLPKLQDLHDRGRILFVICTNHLESMDPAIKRGGRIDHLVGVGPPDRTARLKIIQQCLQDPTRMDIKTKYLDEAIDELATKTERFTRGEIDRAAVLVKKEYTSAAAAREFARKVSTEMSPSLTISVTEFVNFEKQKREFSHPHIERGLK
jgi:hypothetical protein